MRPHCIVSRFATALLLFVAADASAETAVVSEGKINVRAQPSLAGEVITQLQRGDKVTLLERVTAERAKSGEPTNWAKIKLPQNTPVWVFAPFVKDGVVSASRLNLRAGQGENYSVIGRLLKGDAVKPIRTVEEWMEIESPTNAYAFVDLQFLQLEGGTNTLVRTPTANAPTNNSQVAVVSPAPPGNAPPKIISETVARREPSLPPRTPVSKPEEVVSKPNVVTAPPTTAPPGGVPSASPSPSPTVAQNLPKVAPPVPKRSLEPPPKRVVRREGLVRPTKSIQAPTWYELVHPETKKTINYLFEENLGMNLKDYRGQKVVVSGEEAIDPRWPNTPILDMQTLEVLP